MTVKARITILTVSVLFFTIMLGVGGMFYLNQTVQGLRTVYLDRVIPLRDLKDISDAYAVSIVDAAHLHGQGQGRWRMRKKRRRIDDEFVRCCLEEVVDPRRR